MDSFNDVWEKALSIIRDRITINLIRKLDKDSAPHSF